MADFVAVLKKTIGGLNDNTPQMREKIYQKARDTVAAKLEAMQPPPSPIVVERQKKALEAAISAVESGYAAEAEPVDEFASIFAGPDKAEAATKTPVIDTPPAVADAASAVQSAASEDSEPAAVPEQDGLHDDAALKPAETTARPGPTLAGSDAAGDRSTGARSKSATGRRVSGGLIAAAVALIALVGAGYAVWLNRDAFASLFAPADEVALAPADEAAEAPADKGPAQEEQAAEPEGEGAATDAPGETPAEATGTQIAAAAGDEQQKFTQRLTPQGTETDPGPAGGEPSIGEGTTVASATQQPGGETAEPRAPAAQAGGGETALPVGQRAIFYEERTTAADSTAETGATVWSVVQESPGGDLPPEPAIRAEVTIPSKDIQLRMTIRRNADASLPASHIIEMIFLTADGFEGGGIDNVLRVAFKPSEAAPGNPLIGIPAKIADGYFLIALSDADTEREFNLQLMRRQSWIDVPIVYSSGRRALVTMERGVPGDRAFVDVLATWQKLISEQASAPAGN